MCPGSWTKKIKKITNGSKVHKNLSDIFNK